ncbi:MAG TPA: hypothetical protein VF498_02305 [Anaerolineales bacterium]
MLVTLQELDLKNPQPVAGGKAIGYGCKFQSELGAGTAFFVPSSSRASLEELLAQSIYVEVEAEAFQGFQLISEPDNLSPQLIPLDNPGDFTAVGIVRSIVWLDDAYEDSVLEVQVGTGLFSITSTHEIGSRDLDYGQWVTFHIRGLSLWEIDL